METYEQTQERLARTWDAAYRLYVKHPNNSPYEVMCQAYDELVAHSKQPYKNIPFATDFTV